MTSYFEFTCIEKRNEGSIMQVFEGGPIILFLEKIDIK